MDGLQKHSCVEMIAQYCKTMAPCGLHLSRYLPNLVGEGVRKGVSYYSNRNTQLSVYREAD